MSTKPDNDRVLAVSQIVTKLAKAMEDELHRSMRTCINCLHFDNPNEECRKYGNQRPPARIIALGCDGHEDDIPF